MKYYPIYLDVREMPCVVFGGGPVAERKALSLLEAGADVTIVSPSLTPKLRGLAASGKVRHLPKAFEEKDITGAFLVIAATDSPEVNTRIGRTCRKRRVLVNVAAPPEESLFIVPSVVERGDLLIAVSTSGALPALSKKIREELEARYGPVYELFLQKLAAVRRRLMDEVADEHARQDALKAILDSDVMDLLRQGMVHEADHRIGEIIGLKPG